MLKGAFGTNVALSPNRKYLIVGAPTLSCTNNGGGTAAGAIQIFSGVV